MHAYHVYTIYIARPLHILYLCIGRDETERERERHTQEWEKKRERYIERQGWGIERKRDGVGVERKLERETAVGERER